MPDIDKLFEKAEKYLLKQKFESALETYQEIYKYQPDDEGVLAHLGDLCLKLSRTTEGLRFQAQLVDLCVKRNDLAKAVATCRKILKLSPQDVKTLVKMAGLLEKTHKNNEALEAYREALQIHRKTSATQGALECLQRIVKLEPQNLDVHIELAELATQAGQRQVGTPAFLTAAQLARKAGQEDRWAELVERAHGLDALDEAACVAAAEVRLKRDRAADAVALLEPIARNKPDDLTVAELLAQGYLQTGDYTKADPLCWKLFQARPETIGLLVKLAEGLLQSGDSERALKLAAQLRDQLIRQGKREDFLKILEKVYAVDEGNLELLEMLSSLYNEMNREDGLRCSLVRLFNLYLAVEQYEKAADTLERIIDVEPYGQGHYDRLLNLEGHIDQVWYQNIVSRLQPPSAARTAPPSAAGPGGTVAQVAESLEDLIVEGEMYCHYQLTSKLAETVQKINRLFPGAEERNPRVRELYDVSGFVPAPSRAAPAASGVSAPVAPSGEPLRAQPSPPPQSLEDLKRISDITANIYRESTPQGVMQVAVNEIGRALNAGRCWGALGSVDRPPTLTVEYCSPATSASDVVSALKLYVILNRQASAKPDGWLMGDITHFPGLASALPEIQKLGLKSLLALPLMDREALAGLILVEQCDARRAWTPGEALLLKAIATQVLIAVNNTKLRRLVRSIGGSDEETGLLPRSAYLDCLLAEASRAQELSKPLCVCLLEPENSARLVKTLGNAGLQRYFQQVSKTVLSTLRQNDIAIRYNPYSISVVFPDTALPNGGLAVEKLQRAISQIKLDGAPVPVFCTAVCDVPLGPSFDAVDGVTEVINRLESTLEQAHKEGGKRVLLSRFEG